MDIGMLWFDNDKGAAFNTKVRRAVSYYKNKYGEVPNLCFVNPCMVPPGSGNGDNPNDKKGTPLIFDGVEIRESNSMLPNHFWVGINRRAGTTTPSKQ